MAWRPHSRARVDPSNPQAFGVCDRCGFVYNLVNLPFQYDWRGSELKRLNIRVCDVCYDTPYEGNRPIKLPADPPGILNARPILYADSSNAPVIQGEPFWDESGLFWDEGSTNWSP